jgi:RNA-directed DNA polymerase
VRITEEIVSESQRLISRHEHRGRLLAEEHRRRTNRTTSSPPRHDHERPPHWGLDRGFDPYLARANAARIGHSIRRGLANLAYRPRHPVLDHVPKPGGGLREICKYQVADSAVSRMIFESVRAKNASIMSAHSYAYRADASGQHAMQYIKSHFAGRARLYVAEYDFSKYFDTIDHAYIREVLEQQFFLTRVERAAVESFLNVSPVAAHEYASTGGGPRSKGIPQGTSISLFLANAAAWELDRELEGLGVRFVRYADDTLIWADDYGRIAAAADVLQERAGAMGVSVNTEKSPGIRLLVPPNAPDGEIRTTRTVEYLGHKIATASLAIKDSSSRRLMGRIDRLVYGSLLREPIRGHQDLGRLAPYIDRDYSSTIERLRRYLYGDLDEKSLRRFATRGAPLRRFQGAMSAYPLVDDAAQLEALDEAMLTMLWLALRKRGNILAAQGAPHLPPPHGMARARLKDFAFVHPTTLVSTDLAVPSFQRIANVLGGAAKTHGPTAVGRLRLYDE